MTVCGSPRTEKESGDGDTVYMVILSKCKNFCHSVVPISMDALWVISVACGLDIIALNRIYQSIELDERIPTVVKSPANICLADSRLLGGFQLDGDHHWIELALLFPSVQESCDLDDVKLAQGYPLEMDRITKVGQMASALFSIGRSR